ncbi:trichohyalin-like isoform X3 [Littorina saxatilis]|uniref:trichohyalin-like isoform X3 n=1 Tax=Littorina saxatilis TaxID=31220 RepID=UPI0038B5339E
MGIQDFLTVFDRLDAARRGFITVDQLLALHESVYFTPVGYDHVEAALNQVCGPAHGGKVKRDHFLVVLEEISRRQSLEEQAYWDFQALDLNGSHRIRLQDALTLFQEYHEDSFSLHTWHRFLQSRLDPASDVYFDEIREWLCSPPSGEPASDREVREELSRIDQANWEHFHSDYEGLKLLKEGDQKDGEEQYFEDTKRHANRKLEKWNRQGLASMLTDDGMEAEGEETVKPVRRRDAVSASDLLDAVEIKYSLLTDLLVSYMAAFAANMDSEKAELAAQIRRSLTKLAKNDKIRDVDSLSGSSAMLPFTVLRLMGDLQPGHQRRAEELESLRQTLQQEGKSASQIDELLRKEYESSSSGPLRCGEALTDLMQRKAGEKDLLLALTRGQADGSSAPWSLLCRLQRQLIILRDLTRFLPAALAVGLAERLQTYQHQVYDSDRDRSELLAKERLLDRQGRALTRTTSQLPDISEIQGSGGISIRETIVTEVELKHRLEREALIFMLQGPESKQQKMSAQKMSGEERHERLLALRNHHLNWKTGNSGDSAPNFKILEEAVGLYWVERQSQIEKQQHNVADSMVNAAVLADLQQKQEMDFAQCLENMAGKRGEDLISLLKQESRLRFQEHFNNVAFVVLGAVEVSKEDQEYVDALSEKYRAVRDQIFVFALKDRLGHGGWNGLGREGRQAELQKLRKEEKKLRGDGLLVDMANIIGPKSQALPALVHLLGDNKSYGKGLSTPVSTKPVNLLADLVPRFDLEQQNLLSWLHEEETQSSEGQGQKLRELVSLEVERFSIGVDGDYEAGLTALGLVGRIRTVPGGRSMGDKEKQQRLAGKRVALRKWRTRQGEPYKIPAEDKTPPTPGDKVSWQRAALRSMLRRQAVERELLLRVLQDPGFSELVEAAAGSMEAEERWQRLAYLAEKQKKLDFSTPDGREEHASIMEEAAALRVVGVRAMVRSQSGRAMSEDEVCTALLTELQDLHDSELSQQLQGGLNMDESALQPKLETEKKSREEEHAVSVMTVFTRIDGDAGITDVFVKLLEDKYTALRESLLLSSVLQRGGERLAQKQKDKQLQALRKYVVPLWEKGDAEQVAKMLGPDLTLERPLAWMLGMERGKFTKERDAAEGNDPVKEPGTTEDTGVLAAVKHLMQRYAEEKDFLMASLAGANGQFMSEKTKLALKSRMEREKIITAAEEGVEFAALACGLVERQAEDVSTPQLEKDRERYGRLSQHEYGIRQSGREGRQKKDSLNVDRTENREALQDAVLHLLLKKHVEERQLLVEMLINPRFENIQRETALETGQQRSDRLAVLKSKRQSSTLESSSDNLALLQESLVVFREIRRGHQGRGSSPEDDLHLNCQIMAALLLLQNAEAEQYLGDFPTEESNEMIESQEQILEELRKNHCLNIASLVFSPETLTSEGEEEVDPIVEALEGKYDALRDKLLLQALIDQIGEKNWQNMSEKERQRRLMELKLKERQLRREGKFDELAALLGDALNNEATLKKLIGENREEYERKLKERLEKRRQRLAEGMSKEECDRLEKEEEEQEEEEARQRRRNVLEDLQHNFDQEREDLLRRLREGKNNPDRERQKQMLQLRLEQRRLRRDDDIHSTALLLHQHDQSVKDKLAERRRQEQLARERLEAARLRKKEGRSLGDDGQLSVIANDLETEEDHLTLQEIALTSLDLKHQSERELLITLLDGHKDGKHANTAEGMTAEELTGKLTELGEVFQQWRNNHNLQQDMDDVALQLLGEALAYALELKRLKFTLEGKSASDEHLQVALLADLQQIQDKECSDTMASVIDMDNDRLKQLVRSIIKTKEQGCHDNVANALTATSKDGQGGEGLEDEDEEGLTEEEKEEKKVVKALEMKYDAMRDKLIIEALIQQYGEVEWKRMSELERQRKLVEMKRKERQLRHEGKMDEVEALLGQHLKHKQDLDAMLGESQQEQKRRLEERLARRRQLKEQRQAEGLDVDDATLDAIQDEEEEQEGLKRKNVLENLQMHFEDEKAALLAGLHRHADAAERERERQRALVKLQRDRLRLQEEDKLDSATLIFSMGQQQHAYRQESLLKERDRQRQLARERLMERKRQILDGKGGSMEVQPVLEEDDGPENVLADGVQQLQEGALLSLDKHQAAERDTLLQLLAKCRRDKETAKQLKTMSDEELRLKLTRAEKEHAAWKKESAKKVAALSDPRLNAKRRNKLTQKARQRWESQMEILGQAMGLKLELERHELEKVREGTQEEELWEELCVITLADLQERQMMLFNNTQESVFTKSKEDLQTLRKAQRAGNREGWFESMSALAFSVEDMSGESMSLSDRRAAEAKLQEEYHQHKQAIMEKVGVSSNRLSAKGDGVDAEAMLRELEAQHAAKKQQLKTDMERQRTEVMQRLEARRRRQTDRDFEAEAVVQMLKKAESQHQAASDRASTERGNQKSLLQERLQQRREARKQAALDSRQEELRMESSPMPGYDGVPCSDSMSTTSSMGMRREKTKINKDVSEDEKQAIYNKLVEQQLRKQNFDSAQRQKQQELLMRRREERKGKREDVAAALFSLGERQKTSLEMAKKGEHKRQMAQIEERVTRAKYERTMTRKSLIAPGSKGYSDEGLEQGDEAMEEKARALEEQFKREAKKVQMGRVNPAASAGDDLLTEKSRMDILKERRRQRKLQKQNE